MSRRKRRRNKRVFPVRYASDYINVTQKPRSLVYNPDDPEGDKWFDNQSRVRTVFGPSNNKSMKMNNTFMHEVPKTKGFKEVSKKPTPRMEVETILRKWESVDGRLHGLDTFHRIEWGSYGGETTWLCFSGEWYFWQQETPTRIRSSCLYKGRKRAEEAIKNAKGRKVLWELPWAEKPEDSSG